MIHFEQTSTGHVFAQDMEHTFNQLLQVWEHDARPVNIARRPGNPRFSEVTFHREYKEKLNGRVGLIFAADMRYYIIPDTSVTEHADRSGILVYDEVLRMSKFVYSRYIDSVLVVDGNLRIFKLLDQYKMVVVNDDDDDDLDVGAHTVRRFAPERTTENNVVLVFYDYHAKKFISEEQSRLPGVVLHPIDVETLMVENLPTAEETDFAYLEDVSTVISRVSREDKLKHIKKISFVEPIAYNKNVFNMVREALAAQRTTPLQHDITSYTFTLERELVHFPHEDLDIDTYKLQMIENPRYRHAYISPEMAAQLGKESKTKISRFLREHGIPLEVMTHYIGFVDPTGKNIASVYNDEMLYPLVLETDQQKFHHAHMTRVASELLGHNNDTIVSHYGNVIGCRFQFELESDRSFEGYRFSSPLTTNIFIEKIIKRIFNNRLPSQNIVKFTVKQRCMLSLTRVGNNAGTSNMMTNIHLFSATVDLVTKRVVLHGLAATGNYDEAETRVGAEYDEGPDAHSEDDSADGTGADHAVGYNPLNVNRNQPGKLRVFGFNDNNFYSLFAQHYRYPERCADTPFLDIDPSKIKGESIVSSSEYCFDVFNEHLIRPVAPLNNLTVSRTRVMLQDDIEVSAHYLSSVMGGTDGESEETYAMRIATARDVPLRYTRNIQPALAKSRYGITTNLKLSAYEDDLKIVFRGVPREFECVLCALQISIDFIEAFKSVTRQVRPTITSLVSFANHQKLGTFDANNIVRFVSVATRNTVKCILYSEKLEIISQSADMSPEIPVVRIMLFGNHAYYIDSLPTDVPRYSGDEDDNGNLNIIVYCDFETVNSNQALVYSYAYAIGDGEPECHLHGGVLNSTVVLDRFIDSLFDKLINESLTSAPITVWFKAWNGARFDYRLLIPHLLSRAGTTTMNFPGLTMNMSMKYWALKYTHIGYDSHNRAITRTFTLKLVDPKLFVSGLSLTEAVQKFSVLTPELFRGIKLEKDAFSHELMQQRFNETGEQSIPLTNSERQRTREYNIQDVVLLRAVCRSLDTVFPGSAFVRSIPTYAYNLLKKSVTEKSDLEGQYSSNVFIRKAILGARVEAKRGEYHREGNPLYMLDVNALYPFSCIGKPLPVIARHKFIKDQSEYPKAEDIIEWLREGRMFITHMSRIGYRPLADELPPLIPRRFEFRKNKKGENIRHKLDVIDWNTWGTDDFICSNILAILIKRRVIDLNECVFGETILFRRTTTIISDFMIKKRDERIKAKEEGNLAVAQCSKDVSNSLIGKLMQRKPTFEDKFLEDGKTYHDFQPLEVFRYTNNDNIPQDHVLARFDISAREYDPVPCQMGCFVLSYAREYMWDTFIRHCGKLGDQYFYTDTDSLLVTKEMYDKFSQTGLLHPTTYGKLKLEFTADKAFIHAKKTYLLIDEERNELKYSLKGFNHRLTTFKILYQNKVYENRHVPTDSQDDSEDEDPLLITHNNHIEFITILFEALLSPFIDGVSVETTRFQGFKTLAQISSVKKLK